MKRLAWNIIILLIFAACSEPHNFSIEGMVTNAVNPEIYLEKFDINGTEAYDSTTLDENGKFKFKGNVSEPTFYKLRLHDKRYIYLLLDSAEHITFSADNLNFVEQYKVEGSYGSILIRQLNERLARTNIKLDSLNTLILLSTKGDHRIEEWKNEMYTTIIDQEDYSKNFINENPFSLASVMAIYQQYNGGGYVLTDLNTIKIAASALYAMYPQSPRVQALYNDTKRMMKKEQNYKMSQLIEQYGTNSPNITLPDKNNKEISLSDLRGKYVLLQFWASFDEVSRTQNSVLKEAYEIYNPKGLEIYQVSIDTIRTDWLEAIKTDGMKWTNVGDMKGSYSALTKFNVRQIPFNYLLNKEGEIVGKNLKGPALNRKLNEILN